MSNKQPEEIFNELHDTGGTIENPPAVQYRPTKTSQKLDSGVKTIEDRIYQFQESLNHWRITIVQNEALIIILCIFIGIMYSYAVNRCTGDLNFPAIVYWLVGIVMVMFVMLLISPGSLPLVVFIKFGVAFAFGHVSMMYMIAVDGHYWHFFTVATCKYPASVDDFFVFLTGSGAGYIYKAWEEIRAAKK